MLCHISLFLSLENVVGSVFLLLLYFNNLKQASIPLHDFVMSCQNHVYEVLSEAMQKCTHALKAWPKLFCFCIFAKEC